MLGGASVHRLDEVVRAARGGAALPTSADLTPVVTTHLLGSHSASIYRWRGLRAPSESTASSTRR